MTDCHTCQLQRARSEGTAPLWDNIYRTAHWDVVHSYNTSLLGWLVLVARPHIASLDEMSEPQALELGRLLRVVSSALRAETGCIKTYVVQFAEAAGHQHVHVHVIPRMADQPDEFKGPFIFRRLGVPEAQRVSAEAMNQLAAAIRSHLQGI